MLDLTKRQIDLITDAFRYAEETAEYTAEQMTEIDTLLGQIDKAYANLAIEERRAEIQKSRLTLDGRIVTTIEPKGEYSGKELGRVWLDLPEGWTYYRCNGIGRARAEVANAPTMTMSEFNAAMMESV